VSTTNGSGSGSSSATSGAVAGAAEEIRIVADGQQYTQYANQWLYRTDLGTTATLNPYTNGTITWGVAEDPPSILNDEYSAIFQADQTEGENVDQTEMNVEQPGRDRDALKKMPMRDIRARAYKVKAKGIGRDEMKANAEILKYLDHIAHLANININDWTPVELLTSKITGKMFKRKTTVNRVFFAQVEKLAPPKPETDLLSESDLIQINNLIKTETDRAVSRLKENRDANFSTAQSRYADYTKFMRAAGELETQINSFQGRSVDSVKTALNNVLKDGWYSVNAISADSIILATSPIMLTYKNPAQKADTTVPMGRFLVKYNLIGFALSVERFQNNVVYNDHYHPHVARRGEVCFGEIRDRMNAAIAKADIETVFNGTRSVLTTYHPDNPYIRLHDFETTFNRNRKIDE